jgi:thioredoxin reductase (NADPH)
MLGSFPTGSFFVKTLQVLRSLAILFPNRIKVIPHLFEDRTSFRHWLINSSSDATGSNQGFRQYFTDRKAQSHSTSPFVWFGHVDSSTQAADPKQIESYLGGHDATLHWCRSSFLAVQNGEQLEQEKSSMVDDGYNPQHTYDYDLVVIGGGSGGMAAAKEAAGLGAKVACLDFVKPSPVGTTWGLGGTCVNVGCIPKKLMHTASLLRESISMDSASFGLKVGSLDADKEMKDSDVVMASPLDEVPVQGQWETLRENVQNYIFGLNFKYRVRLREKNVTYLNKLATFRDAHTLEAKDKKGNVEIITAARFLIAVGGRPTPLDCEGGELAISSDDVFSLEKSPGKTLCIGASYISLECAGFLRGLGLDVTVAVRSILLRGFDRECTDRIDAYMEHHAGIRFKRGVTPSKLEKLPDQKIQVTFSDGSADAYDTVLTAIGRTADTHLLNIAPLGIQTNPKNNRILGKFEQTDCPNIYAVGDVLDVSVLMLCPSRIVY